MAKFQVSITEHATYVHAIEAESAEDAVRIAREQEPADLFGSDWELQEGHQRFIENVPVEVPLYGAGRFPLVSRK